MREYQHHHALTMIERAQRAGRSEQEIVRLVEEHFGVGQVDVVGLHGERRLLRRLLGRAALRKAA